MGEKDILEKVLMSHADVFADCVNVLAYGGEGRLAAENLQPAPTESFYQGKEKLRGQFCDKSFYRMEDGEIRAQYIIENETCMRWRQIVRKVSYQGGAYREQLDSVKPMYPVVGIVLEWTRKSSRIPLSLHRLMEEAGARREELKLTDDAELLVYHMRNLPGEVRSRFISDMGFVADYLNDGSFEGRKEQPIRHGKELCQMMEALTGDKRFTEQMEELLAVKAEKEEVYMCEYIDMLEARGEERGKKIGKKIGKQIGRRVGEQIGEKRGESRLAKLIGILCKEGKYKEIETVSADNEKRQEFYRLYNIT